MQRLQDCIFQKNDALRNKICFQRYDQNAIYQLNYAELKIEAEKIAGQLTAMGIRDGDRVIILSETRPEAIVTFFGILLANATAVILDPACPIAELKKMIEFIDARALLTSAKGLVDLKSEMIPQLAVRLIERQLLPCENYLADVPVNSPLSQDVDREVASILFTSGTSSHAKAVMLTHANLISATQGGQAAIELGEQDSMLVFLPMHHVASLTQILVGLHAGVTLTFVEKLEGQAIISTMQQAHPTYLGVVPLLLDLFLKNIEAEINKQSNAKKMIINMLLHISQRVRSLTSFNIGFYLFGKIQRVFGGRLRCIVSGGAAAKPETVTKLERFGFTILEAYGLTETTGSICSNKLGKAKPGKAGKPFPTVDIRIQDGEIHFKGPMIMKGYFRDPIATQVVMQAGWLNTGDRGWIDSAGYLSITGRSRELIVLHSGKKAIPADIEQYYQSIPGVVELAVFGLSQHSQAGEIIAVAIVVNADFDEPAKKKLIEEQVYQRASSLSSHLQIQRIYFVEALPKTAMQKIKRSMLKQLIEQRLILQTNKSSETDFSNTELWLLQWLSTHLNVSLNEIEKNKSFVYYGLSSLDAMQLCSDIKNQFQIEVQPSEMTADKSIAEFANLLETNPAILNKFKPEHYINIEEYVHRLLNPGKIIHFTRRGLQTIFYSFFKIYLKIEVNGAENIPQGEQVIFCANHSSHLDGVAMSLVTKKLLDKKIIAIVAKDYIVNVSIIKLLADMIPFDREVTEQALSSNMQCISLCKASERSFVMFPEGTRSKDGQLQKIKEGIAWIAEQSGLRIVPVHIDNAHRLMPPGSIFPKPGKLSVRFGKPISFDKNATQVRRSEHYQAFTQQVRLAMLELSHSS